MERLLVAHGTDLLVKGFASVPPDRVTPDGVPAAGLFQVARVIFAGLKFKVPERAVAVLDTAVDPAWDERLQAQLPALPSLFEAHGFHVVATSEPTSVVASYVQASLDAGGDAIVLASDKRFAQLVEKRVWWYDAYKRVRYTPATVAKRFLVSPEHVADWLALVGDDTALSGVKGIGAKGAAGFIAEVGDVREALKDPDAIEGRVGKNLRASLDVAREQLALAHLDRDRPLPIALTDLGYTLPPIPERNAFYADWGFFELMRAESPPAPCDVVDDVSLSGDGALAILHGEPSAIRGEFAGLGITTDAGRYFVRRIGRRVKAWLENPDVAKVGHDTKSIAVALARQGVTLRGVDADSVVASHISDPSGSAPHDLDPVVRARLRRPLQPAEDVLGTGKRAKTWSEVEPETAGAWACEQADAAAALWAHLQPHVEKHHVREYLQLSDTLAKMELAGVPVDADELTAAGEDFVAMAEALQAEIFDLAGHEFNLRSTKQLGTVLYEELGLTVHSRTKTGWSTATHALERIEHDHPIVPLVIRYRLLERLRSNWVVSLRDAIDDDGRVRSTFHCARSFSGRLVNSAPDLGRVPGATPEMTRIRAAFQAPKGSILLSVDYDQLGLYVLAHLTLDRALIEPLRERADMHLMTASACLEIPPDQITKEQRQIGKVVNFATFAGQGASALRRQLGVSIDEARLLIGRFDRRYAKVRAFQDKQFELACKRGWIQTITGRRWPIRDVRSNDPMMRAYGERLARRATHEGSVADVTRRALLKSDQALNGLRARPLLQIHDEVLFEVPDEELDEVMARTKAAFEGAFRTEVPLSASCKAGPTWADMTPRDVS